VSVFAVHALASPPHELGGLASAASVCRDGHEERAGEERLLMIGRGLIPVVPAR
jgi:hypothetical protein